MPAPTASAADARANNSSETLQASSWRRWRASHRSNVAIANASDTRAAATAAAVWTFIAATKRTLRPLREREHEVTTIPFRARQAYPGSDRGAPTGVPAQPAGDGRGEGRHHL